MKQIYWEDLIQELADDFHLFVVVKSDDKISLFKPED